jgi:hypothetical protein
MRTTDSSTKQAIIVTGIPMFNREWRPRGFGLVLAELVFTVTDPPLRFFRRLLPPLRLGPVALDLGFPVTTSFGAHDAGRLGVTRFGKSY